MARDVVQGMWIGETLGTMQRCSIQSFLDAGHPYHLYVYGPVAGVPEGATVLAADEVIPSNRIWNYAGLDTPAGFSNEFRYRLLESFGGTWADLDVICLGHLPESEYLLPTQPTAVHVAATCLLRAPAGSEFIVRARAAAESVDPETAFWGQSGPHLLTALVRELGMDLLPVEAVCAIGHLEWQRFLSDDPEEQADVRRRTAPSIAVHLWHEMWRRAGVSGDEPAPPGSLYADFCERFERRAHAVGPDDRQRVALEVGGE